MTRKLKHSQLYHQEVSGKSFSANSKSPINSKMMLLPIEMHEPSVPAVISMRRAGMLSGMVKQPVDGLSQLLHRWKALDEGFPRSPASPFKSKMATFAAVGGINSHIIASAQKSNTVSIAIIRPGGEN